MLTPEREADLRRLVAPSEIFKHTGISMALTDLLSEIDRLRAEVAALRDVGGALLFVIEYEGLGDHPDAAAWRKTVAQAWPSDPETPAKAHG